MSQTSTQLVSQYAKMILDRIGIMQNPYFLALQSDDMPLEVFRQTQVQFYFAVCFFSRPMSALVARMPSPELRLKVLQNVVDEHGDMGQDAFHEQSFRQFLQSIGQKNLDFDKMTLWPQVRAFNSIITTACVLDEVEVGIACLGIIERAFADISALIGQSVVAHNWLSVGELTHYKLHAELDIQHAEDFFVLIEQSWNEPEKRYLIKQGLELGAYAFDRLYRDLIEYKVE